MQLMKPIYSETIPKESDFIYEVKYDGYRCLLVWEHYDVRLISRNNIDLTRNFPEIIAYCQIIAQQMNDFAPFILDGELVILNNDVQANFSLLQKRGRLKNETKIEDAAMKRPAHFLAFDIIQRKGKSLRNTELYKRKKQLAHLFQKTNTKGTLFNRIDFIPFYMEDRDVRKLVFEHKGEGIVAKRKHSLYKSGKKHNDWFKTKNWRTIYGFLTSYDPRNDYFTVAVFREEKIYEIGKCKHGLREEEVITLKKLFLSNGDRQENGSYILPPAICVAIHTIGTIEDELREPEFVALLPHERAENCTYEKLRINITNFPSEVERSNTDKLFWPKVSLTKGDLLIYLRDISPYMLPFLQEKALTIIRCPDGVTEEVFFQKSLPTYAPSYVKSVQVKDKRVILCDKLGALIWLANHGSVEYHIPFEYLLSKYPMEIAFDLDPPDRGKFHLAIRAALMIKQMMDDLELHSFIKTSGNKGLQLHIPIKEGSMTYEQTAKFTKAVALTIEREAPTLFTTERMKKKRGERLYIDYVQHGKNKTLIAPYSPRKTSEATVATPLFWEEVKEGLMPNQFTITTTVKRVETEGCPFATYKEVGERQKIDKILKMIES